MNTASYPSPVDKLLTFGDCRNLRDWPSYLELGLSAEHINDLVRMATDAELNWADSDSLEVWAPIHAWRALGQLRAEAAIMPLIDFFNQVAPDDDWAPSELPEVMGMIGPAAIPALAAVVANPAQRKHSRTYAGDSLAKIGKQHPASREECIKSLVAGLELFEQNERDLNGFFVSNLLDLQAVEAASVMERAFTSGRVAEYVAGDWEDAQVEFGLLMARKTEPKYSIWDSLGSDEDIDEFDDDEDDEEFFDAEDVDDDKAFIETIDGIHNNRKKRDAAKVKSRRAMAKKSRRQNKKKKKKK